MGSARSDDDLGLNSPARCVHGGALRTAARCEPAARTGAVARPRCNLPLHSSQTRMSAAKLAAVRDWYLPVLEAVRDNDQDAFFALVCADSPDLNFICDSREAQAQDSFDAEEKDLLGRNVLCYAIEKERSSLVQYLLDSLVDELELEAREQRGDADEDRATPLQTAILHNNLAVCELLLKAGAKFDSYTASGKWSMLALALSGGSERRAIAELLIRRGANERAAAQAIEDHGQF